MLTKLKNTLTRKLTGTYIGKCYINRNTTLTDTLERKLTGIQNI